MIRGGTTARWALAAAVVVGLSACSAGSAGEAGVGRAARSSAAHHGLSLEAASTTAGDRVPGLINEPPPTTVPPTTVPPVVASPVEFLAAAPPPGYGPGDRGVAILEMERALAARGYDPGTVDNFFDEDTGHAVMAFQKVNGLERSGRATSDVVAALNAVTGPPAALVPGGGFVRVEVDLDRQVLFLYEGNRLATILNASTGSDERFCSQGWCRYAVTPTGAFTIYEQRHGWETAPLGRLYNSQYFNGGIAIHGSTSVPASPASHGCVRIPMSAAEWFPDRVGVGTPVYVVAAGEPVPLPVGLDPPADVAPLPATSQAAPATTTTTLGLLESLLAPRP